MVLYDGWMDEYRHFRTDGLKRKRGEVSLCGKECLRYMVVFSGMVWQPTFKGKVGPRRWMTVETLWFRVRGETRNYGIVLGLCCRPPDQSEEMGKAFFKQLMTFLEHLFFRGELWCFFSGGNLTSLAFPGQAVWWDVSSPKDFWRVSGKLSWFRWWKDQPDYYNNWLQCLQNSGVQDHEYIEEKILRKYRPWTESLQKTGRWGFHGRQP